MMWKYWVIVFGFVSLKFGTCFTKTINNSNEKNNNWDILIFAQHWPVTLCMQWQENNSNNTCQFPLIKSSWAIHGIWPSRIGSKDSPSFCNKSLHFNMNQLQPIESDLNNYWTNIEKNTKLSSLWKHEWQKHGTCAISLPQLDNELNYFSQGIKWVKEYNITEILLNKGIVPNNKGYDVKSVSDAVFDALDKRPIVQCVVDKNTKNSLLSEVRLCFNKSLELVDCGVLMGDAHYYYQYTDDTLTNCNLNKPVIYPGQSSITKNVDKSKEEDQYIAKITELVKIYKTLQFLIWVTL